MAIYTCRDFKVTDSGGNQQALLEPGSLLGHFWVKRIKPLGHQGHPVAMLMQVAKLIKEDWSIVLQ